MTNGQEPALGRAERLRAERDAASREAPGFCGIVKRHKIMPLRDMATATMRWLIRSQIERECEAQARALIQANLRGAKVLMMSRHYAERLPNKHVAVVCAITIFQVQVPKEITLPGGYPPRKG